VLLNFPAVPSHAPGQPRPQSVTGETHTQVVSATGTLPTVVPFSVIPPTAVTTTTTSPTVASMSVAPLTVVPTAVTPPTVTAGSMVIACTTMGCRPDVVVLPAFDNKPSASDGKLSAADSTPQSGSLTAKSDKPVDTSIPVTVAVSVAPTVDVVKSAVSAAMTSEASSPPVVIVRQFEHVKPYTGASSHRSFKEYFERISKANKWVIKAQRRPST